MNKRSWLMRLTAFVVALTMMIGITGVVYSEENSEPAEVTEASAPAAEDVTAAEEAARKAAEEEAARKAAEEEAARIAAEQAAEEESVPEEPQAEEAPAEEEKTMVTELENEEISFPEVPEEEDDDEDFDDFEEDEDFGDDDFEDDDDLVEFDEDEFGEISEDLLEQFNNMDSFESVEFSGSADIELRETDDMWEDGWDGRITLVAKVRDANLSYRLVWEANDHDDRGWFTVGSGDEYSYTLTKDNVDREANREYRVVMFTVD